MNEPPSLYRIYMQWDNPEDIESVLSALSHGGDEALLELETTYGRGSITPSDLEEHFAPAPLPEELSIYNRIERGKFLLLWSPDFKHLLFAEQA